MIDCSHGNSQKNPEAQSRLVNELSQRIANQSQAPFGIMLESNLIGGKQSLSQSATLKYGQSITDPCMSWETTESTLATLSDAVRLARKNHDILL